MNKNSMMLEDLRRIMRLYDAMLKPVCREYGLVQLEATIISFLYNNPGKDTAADIAEYRMLSKSNVSAAVKTLLRKGLLEQMQDKTDRRRIHLCLTRRTAPITAAIQAVRDEYRALFYAGFSQEEQALFTQFHRRLADNARAVQARIAAR